MLTKKPSESVQVLPEEKENPRPDCPALGKNAIVCRAFNSAYPDKIYYKCPFCDYCVEKK